MEGEGGACHMRAGARMHGVQARPLGIFLLGGTRRDQDRCPQSEVLAGQRTWHMANGGSSGNGDS